MVILSPRDGLAWANALRTGVAMATGASFSCIDLARTIMHGNRLDAIPRAFQVIVCAQVPDGYDSERGEVD